MQKLAVDSIFCADVIVTQDKEHLIIEKGALAVLDGKIRALGTQEKILAEFEAKHTCELGRSVILPGLINGHTHCAMSFLRGRADDKPLMDWLIQDIFPVEAHLTDEMVKNAALFSTTEFLRTGTTTICDMYPLADSVCSALSLSGMRGLIGESVLLFPTASYANGQEALEKVQIMMRKWGGRDKLKVAIFPHAIYTTDRAYLEQCRDIALDLNIPLGMHLSETQIETQNCIKDHGVRPVEYCRDLGLIYEKSLFFHAVDMNEVDLEMIAGTGASLIHNPTSNMKLASGVAPIDAMKKWGIPMGLGTDGPASNNAQNMFREMMMAAMLQKVAQLEATACPATQALDMATSSGAQALHWEGIGSLEVGHEADFIALDLTTPNMQPLYNIVSQLVYSATGMETKLSVVGGEILYQDGKYTRVDYDALCEEITSIKNWVLSLS